jgi:hypothetical protein
VGGVQLFFEGVPVRTLIVIGLVIVGLLAAYVIVVSILFVTFMRVAIRAALP